jgi:hypothetical protein
MVRMADQTTLTRFTSCQHPILSQLLKRSGATHHRAIMAVRDTIWLTLFTVDSSRHAEAVGTRILRGPYVQCAYNYGWKSWSRKIDDSEKTNEWEETSDFEA